MTEKPKNEGGAGLGGLSGVVIWNFKFEISIGHTNGAITEPLNTQVWRGPVWIYYLHVVSV